MTTKTLILDIETAPALGYTWRLFDATIGLNQVIDPGGVISWAAGWAGDDNIMYDSVGLNDKRSMLSNIYDLLEEADQVVGWNSNSFDLKHLNGEFWLQGWGPPSPYKKIDCMRVAKGNFKLLSNKLEFALQRRLKVGKQSNEGFGLWLRCLNGEAAAWRELEHYNVMDVIRTEEIYETMRPWIPGSNVNQSAIALDHVCPECGSKHMQSRGTYVTQTQEYRRFRCNGCGTWSRARMPERSDKSKVLVKAAR